MVVDGCLDVKDADCVLDQLALSDARVMERRVWGVHVRQRAHQRLHVVVLSDAAIGGEARGHRLVAAIHRHQRQVYVDNKI